MHSLSTEADLAQGAIMGHPWEEDLFILSGVKGHFQHGKSQAFDSEEGHCGRGNIFIWASGNGGLASDCSGVDGYMNSIYSGAKHAIVYLCSRSPGLQEQININATWKYPLRKDCGV